MKKLRIIRMAVVVALATTAALPASAQEIDQLLDKYTQMKQERDQLAAKVADLEKQLGSAEKNWAKKQKAETDSILRVHKAALGEKDKLLKDTVSVLTKTIKELEKNMKKNDQQAVDQLKEELETKTKERDVLERERDQLQAERDRLQKQKHDADSLVAARERELKELEPFRELQLKQTLEQAKEWAALPFSQLDADIIGKTLDDCHRFGANNADFQKAAKGLETLQAELLQYNNAMALLDKPYDEAAKKEAREQLKKLLAKYKGKPQQQELAEVDVLLRDYDGYVLMFQDFIGKIDSELDDWRESKNVNNARSTLDLCLEDQEQKENIQEISRIPYLKQRLGEYLAALKDKPLQHWKGEDEIKNMVK